MNDDPARPGGPARHAHRVDAFYQALVAAGDSVERAAVERLMRAEWSRYSRVHRDEQRTLSNRERIIWMTQELHCDPLPAAAVEALDLALDDSLFAGPPRLLPGLDDLLRRLAERAPLAIISDTSYSTGKTLRRLLEHEGVLDCFQSTVFSDEIGCAKPSVEPFAVTRRRLGLADAPAVHIGDREQTDVEGAKRAGFDAVLFLGALPEDRVPAEVATAADYTVHSVSELGRLLLERGP